MRPGTVRLYVLYALALLAVIAPVLAAIQLAEYRSIQSQEDRATQIASEVRRRADAISTQISRAFSELDAARFPEPCSEKSLELMRRLVVGSNLLIDVGYAKHDELICSSFGIRTIPIGPVTFKNKRGFLMRTAVAHPYAPETPVNLVTDPATGYTILLSPATMLDSVQDEPNLSIGTFSPIAGVNISQRGYVDPAWFAKVSPQAAGALFNGHEIFAWDRSREANFVAYAAIAGARVDSDRRRIVATMIPIGLLAGFVLAVVIAALVRRHTSVPGLLRSALKRNEISLVYQPIINIQTGTCVGMEALVRWTRSSGETINPDVFVPIAEQHGLIRELTAAVLARVEDDAAWVLRRNRNLYVAVNMSAQDFASEDTVSRLKQTVQRMGISADQLHVEATERVFMNVDVARRAISEIRNFGIQVAIDDFGTGYSSLAYLHSLQLDYLKIDKSFVDTIGTQAVTSHVIDHVINMSRALNVELIAEGVETQEQAQYLQEHGVKYAQGWLYSRPLTMAQLLAGPHVNAASDSHFPLAPAAAARAVQADA